MEKVLRRRSDSLMCQYLWDAITTIRNHKQLPSFDRIRRYMNRTHSMDQEKVEKYLEECTLDNLIVVSRKVGQKGSKVGVEQEGFRLPTAPEEPESHDWYCFECHRSGEVGLCTKCYRVYHTSCLETKDFPLQPNLFICSVCKKRLYQRSPSRCRITREELNGLLLFLVAKLKEKMPLNILERTLVSTSSKSQSYSNDRAAVGSSSNKPEVQAGGGPNLSEPWRAQLLLHHQMDLRTMEQKAHDGRYKTLYDFEIDVRTVIHNAVIYHGASSSVADISRQMLRDCQHDLAEVDQCKDCFRYSMDKSQRHWFCKPCNPPHELVYAKEKGFPFWPAKVLKVENDLYQVRFFGTHHQTANIDKSCIKSINTNIQSFQVKRTSAWMKAYEELKKHQELLASGYNEPPLQQGTPYPTHAFQPPPPRLPPPPFQQPYHPFHTHQQFHPPYHQPHPILHQQPWEAVPSADHHPQRLIPSGLLPHPPPPPAPAPHFPFQKKDSEPVSATPENSSQSVTVDHPKKAQKSLSESLDSSLSKPDACVGQSAPENEPMDTTDELPSSAISSSFKSQTCKPSRKEAPEDMVSSSSQENRSQSQGVQTSPRLLKKLLEEINIEQSAKRGKNAKDMAEKMKKEFEFEKEKSFQESLEKMKKELKKTVEDYEDKIKNQISATKRKQWCWTCEAEAIYHCCWNTAYCSVECQQQHWHKEHKKNCRRKC